MSERDNFWSVSNWIALRTSYGWMFPDGAPAFDLPIMPTVAGTSGSSTGARSIEADEDAGGAFSDGAIPITATVSIAATDAAKAEGQSGSTGFTFTVTRSGDLSGEHSVLWFAATEGDTPADIADFLSPNTLSGEIVFAPGEATRTIEVAVKADLVTEPDEGFAVHLAFPAPGLGFGTRQASGLIHNDDVPRPALQLRESNLREVEGQSGGTALTFHLDRSTELASSWTGTWRIEGAGAGALTTAADFPGGIFPSGSVSMAAGVSSVPITVMVRSDLLYEAAERFTLSVWHGGTTDAANLADTALGTILNDDTSVYVSIAEGAKAEGQTTAATFTFGVHRRGPAEAAQSVDWEVAPAGAARAGATDFEGGVLPSGRLDFAPGETLKTVTVTVASDRQVEADESFMLRLLNPSPGLTIGRARAPATILNDDTAVSVAAAVAAVVEGNSGTVPFTFTLTRSGDLWQEQGVSWSLLPAGTIRVSLSDFAGSVVPTGRAEFAPGQATSAVTVHIAGDTMQEENEGFQLRLSAPSEGLGLGTFFATAAILDDDYKANSVSVVADRTAKPEGDDGITPFTFTITRSSADAPASVGWWVQTVAGGIVTDDDFANGRAPEGMVDFAAGETSRRIAVRVVGDLDNEPHEEILLRLRNPSPGLTIAAGEARSTILNDDAYVYTYTPNFVTMRYAEGTGGISAIPVTIGFIDFSASPIYSITINWRVEGVGENPASAADFIGGVLPSGSVTLMHAVLGQQDVSIDLVPDAELEPDETFRLILDGPASPHYLQPGTFTIGNDDPL